jgi:hypothetical protein
MIIVSQDCEGNHTIEKRIVNFDNVQYLMLDKMANGECVIIFKDNTMTEEHLKDFNCILGIYKTEERAKGVLQEIIKAIKGKTIIQTTVEGMKCENLSNNIFEMPKE